MSKIKRLLNYDKDNKDKGDRKIFITWRHWGFIINTKIKVTKNKNLAIYVAKYKNLFRFPNKDWVYFPKLNILYEKIISCEIEKYYEDLKRSMQSEEYEFVEKNKYNTTHVRLLKKGGNKFFKSFG